MLHIVLQESANFVYLPLCAGQTVHSETWWEMLKNHKLQEAEELCTTR